MKKLISLLCALFLFSSLFAAPVRAESSVTITELGLDLTLPDELYFITRELPPGDPAWEMFDLPRDEMIRQLADNSFYLFAFPGGLDYTITLSVKASEEQEKIFDFNLYPDDEIMALWNSEELNEELDEQLEFEGVSLSDVRVHQSPEAKYLVFSADIAEEGSSGHLYQYTTVYNGRAYSLSVISLGEAAAESYDEVLCRIADSVHFHEKLKPSVSTYAEEQSKESPLRAAFNLPDFLGDLAIGAAGGFIWWLAAGKKKEKRGKRVGDPEL